MQIGMKPSCVWYFMANPAQKTSTTKTGTSSPQTLYIPNTCTSCMHNNLAWTQSEACNIKMEVDQHTCGPCLLSQSLSGHWYVWWESQSLVWHSSRSWWLPGMVQRYWRRILWKLKLLPNNLQYSVCLHWGSKWSHSSNKFSFHSRLWTGLCHLVPCVLSSFEVLTS